MTVLTRAQRQLRFAHQYVADIAGQSFAKKYGTIAHAVDPMVRTSGLAQAIAFIQARAVKGDDGEQGRDQAAAYQHIRAHIAGVLHEAGLVSQNAVDDQGAGLLDEVQHLAAWDYLCSERELLAAWSYFRRFAVSVLKVSNTDEDDHRSEPPSVEDTTDVTQP